MWYTSNKIYSRRKLGNLLSSTSPTKFTKESCLHNAVMKSNVYITSKIYERVGMNADGVLVLKYTRMIKSASKIFANVLL